MCVIAFTQTPLSPAAPDSSPPLYRFVSTLNRDEQALRTTLLPEQNPIDHIICATDVKAQGTSSGVNTQTGVYVSLTNYHDPAVVADETYTSRGLLVRHLLEASVDELQQWQSAGIVQLNCKLVGYSLIVGRLFDAQAPILFVTNRPTSPQRQELTGRTPLPISIKRATATALNGHAARHSYVIPLSSDSPHAFSNSCLDDQQWPRVTRARQSLSDIVKQANEQHSSIQQLVDTLAAAMSDATIDATDLSIKICAKPACVIDSDAVLLNNPRDRNAIQLAKRMVFIPPHSTVHKHLLPTDEVLPPVDPQKVWATRSQTIVIATVSDVHYYYRLTDKYPEVSEWQHFIVPIPHTANGVP